MMKRKILTAGVLLLLTPSLYAGILTSKHNLSVTGPGAITAASEVRICIFCHTPHNSLSTAPLWNRSSSIQNYTPYTSSTLVSSPGQPTGTSILCLSCHDGSIALGNVNAGAPVGGILMAGGMTTMPQGSAGHLGTDLRDDHPFSFAYTSLVAFNNGQLKDPSTLVNEVRLDATGQIQCTTCHDPHNNTYNKFLVKSNFASALCETCHNKRGWLTSSHRNATNTWNQVGPNPWPKTDPSNPILLTVAANGCGNCHSAHSASAALVTRLFTQNTEEDVCFVCHSGTVSVLNVRPDFTQPTGSTHPLRLATGVHDPVGENPIQTRHVECVDCHEAHEANVSPVGVVGIKGADWLGTRMNPIAEKYQLCLKCHGTSPNKTIPVTKRQIRNPNMRNISAELDPMNPSLHPLRALSPNPNVPSLLPGVTWAIFKNLCFDCHGAPGDALHGSPNVALLKLRYDIRDPNPESAAAYALCYSCHNRLSILGDNTFKEHSQHIQGENTPCNTCHAPHGVSMADGGTALNNAKLINFNINVVTPINGVLKYTTLGLNTGMCTLMCHGTSHNPKSY